MARQEKNPARMLTPRNGFPRGRLIWARVFEAEAMEEGNEPSYSCAILYKENQDIGKIRKAIKAAISDMGNWGGKLPRKGKTPLIEGEDIEELADKYDYIEEGDVILKLRRYEKFGAPQLWDQDVEPIESPTEMYSGCHVVADVEFYGWDRTKGSKASGVSCRLNGLQKVRDDDALAGGGADTKDSFQRQERSDDDDDDDDDDDRPARSKAKAKTSKRKRDDDDDDSLI